MIKGIDTSKLVFEPMIPLKTMIIIGIIMVIIVFINRKNVINRLLIILLLGIISQRPMIK